MKITPAQISSACLRGRACPGSLVDLCEASARGALPPGIARLLTSLEILEAGYGSAVEAEGADTAANVRAHRRVFERLGFFAEDEDGALWAFDLAANVDEPPVAALDTEGQYSWRGANLAQALARDTRAAGVATQFLPGLRDLHAGYYAQESGAPRSPRRMAPLPASANAPESWLLRPGAEVRAALGETLPQEAIAKCDGEGLVVTVWLPREGALASLPVRGISLGTSAARVRERLGAPTKEGAQWVRFDGAECALHFEIGGEVVTRITMMASPPQ